MHRIAGDAKAPLPEDRLGARAGGAAQDVAHVLSIRTPAAGNGGSGQPGEGRQKIHRGQHGRGLDAPRRNAARQPRQQRQAHSAFIQTALAAAEWTRRAHGAVAGVHDVNILGSVIAGEQHQRIVGESKLVELSQQASHLFVQVGDRSVEDLHRAFVGHASRSEARVELHLLFGGTECRVRNQAPDVQVERPRAVLLDETDAFVDDKLAGPGAEIWIAFVPARAIGVDRAVVVEAVGFGTGRPLAAAEVPFSEVRRGVARLLQNAREGGHGGVEPVRHSPGLVHFGRREVAVDLVPRRKMTGRERRAAGRTDRIVHVELREEGSLAGQSIQVGSLDVAMAVAAEIAPAQVVGENENNVGRAAPLGLEAEGAHGGRGGGEKLTSVHGLSGYYFVAKAFPIEREGAVAQRLVQLLRIVRDVVLVRTFSRLSSSCAT